MNLMMMIIIIVIFYLSFIDLLSSDEIFIRDLGKDVTFSCIFENELQFNQVSFMHQTTGDILSVGLDLFVDESIGHNHMKLIRFSSNRLDLKILSINQNDSGLYTCMLNDDKLSSFLLEIYIPPRFISYLPLDASVSYPEGSSMNLSCHAFAIPSPNITWIYRDKNKQSKIIHNGEDVYISSVKSSDSGLYECIASNGYHATINRSFYVTVLYPPRIINNKSIEIHKLSIRLLCEICSMPLSYIQWIKDDKHISNNQYFHVKTELKLNENEECVMTILTIHDLLHEKYGRYECRAENYLGHKSHHIDYYPKIVSKSQPQNEHILFLTLQNGNKSISNSSESFFRLSKIYLLTILLVNFIYLR